MYSQAQISMWCVMLPLDLAEQWQVSGLLELTAESL